MKVSATSLNGSVKTMSQPSENYEDALNFKTRSRCSKTLKRNETNGDTDKNMIIVDTDVLIEIFDKKSLKGESALEQIEQSGEHIAITSVSLHEILYGIYKYGKHRISEVEKLETIEYTRDDAILSAKLELDAEKKGCQLSRTDAMIAAIALNKKATLFTFNKKHFQVIPKLVFF